MHTLCIDVRRMRFKGGSPPGNKLVAGDGRSPDVGHPGVILGWSERRSDSGMFGGWLDGRGSTKQTTHPSAKPGEDGTGGTPEAPPVRNGSWRLPDSSIDSGLHHFMSTFRTSQDHAESPPPMELECSAAFSTFYII